MKHTLEALIAVAVVVGVNAAFPGDPAFASLAAAPYVMLALFVAATRGRLTGYGALLAAAVLTVAVFGYGLPWLLPDYAAPVDLRRLWLQLRVPIVLTLFATFIFGALAARAQRKSEQDDGDAAGSSAKRLADLHTEIRALTDTNRALQNRVSGQRDSITYLYTRMSDLYSHNVQKALDVILDAVHYFTGAERSSLWEYDRQEQRLVVRAQRGWGETGRPATMSVEDSIEGWVVRNNRPFTVKMLVNYDNLRRLDDGHVIYSFPVSAGRSLWGALDVEALPFASFNTYTEQVMLLIAALAAPALEQALEYESKINVADVDEDTGYPLFGQFYSVLREEVEQRTQQRATVSVILVEVGNYAQVSEVYGRKAALETLTVLIDAALRQSDNAAGVFHYKEAGQLALIYPDLDFDGASLFALNFLEWVTQNDWQHLATDAEAELDGVGGGDDARAGAGTASAPTATGILPEVILGYAALSAQAADADTLMEMSENLLQMQKI